ncbi:DUF1653 domain-containing protein [Candidatus Nomurabacteria bacterium]|nr:DUF1653 domain-containing protein [Candidatus Nomurabacteria bacterium]
MNKPKKGEIYKHFKHDPNGEENNHIYRIVGISVDTETEEKYVVYEPLNTSELLIGKSAQYFSRPLKMFMEEVDRDEYKGLRFIKID